MACNYRQRRCCSAFLQDSWLNGGVQDLGMRAAECRVLESARCRKPRQHGNAGGCEYERQCRPLYRAAVGGQAAQAVLLCALRHTRTSTPPGALRRGWACGWGANRPPRVERTRCAAVYLHSSAVQPTPLGRPPRPRKSVTIWSIGEPPHAPLGKAEDCLQTLTRNYGTSGWEGSGHGGASHWHAREPRDGGGTNDWFP